MKARIVAAKKNIKKAQKVWAGMTPRQRALAQPQGRGRAKPGTTGEGKYFRIVVRPKGEFTTFRYHDVGSHGHIQRLAGKRRSGSWSTQAWLIAKGDAHRNNGMLIADTRDAQKVLDTLGTKPKHVKADIFEAKDRPNIPESAKLTRAQTRAWTENIQKAQAARTGNV